MKDWQSQAHVKWECKYHVVIVPKYRKKVLYGKLRHKIGEILRQLCRQKGLELLEGHAMPDHVHMLLSVPPKYSIAMTIGYLKGKSAIRINRDHIRVKGSLFGRSFWSRGYCETVSSKKNTLRDLIEREDGPRRKEKAGQAFEVFRTTLTQCAGQVKDAAA